MKTLLLLLIMFPAVCFAQSDKWKVPTIEHPAYITNTAKNEGGIDWRMPTKGFTKQLVTDTAWYNAGGAAYFVDILNKYRVSKGLQPLELSQSACRAAKLQCENIAKLGYTTHYNNPTYPTPMSRLLGVNHKFGRAHGYGSFAQENCNRYENKLDPFTKDVMFIIFMGYKVSPAHNEAMLGNEATKVGVYTVKRKSVTYHVTIFTI